MFAILTNFNAFNGFCNIISKDLPKIDTRYQ